MCDFQNTTVRTADYQGFTYDILYIGEARTLIEAEALELISDYFSENSRLTVYVIDNRRWVDMADLMNVGRGIIDGGFPLVPPEEFARIEEILEVWDSQYCKPVGVDLKLAHWILFEEKF